MFRIPTRLRKPLLALLMLPLAITGPCPTIAVESTIGGFFNALIPILDDRLQDELADYYADDTSDPGNANGTGTDDTTDSGGTTAS